MTPERTRHLPPGIQNACQALFLELDTLAELSGEFWPSIMQSLADKGSKAETKLDLMSALEGFDLENREEICRCLERLLASFADNFPEYPREMELRMGPLQAQWEAMGPGLYRELLNRTQLPGSDDQRITLGQIHLLQPVVGGAGYMLESPEGTQSIAIEAVLTNEIPALPETLRIAWLLAGQQLQAQTKIDSDSKSFKRQICLHLLTLPAAIETAESFGFPPFMADAFSQAVNAWLPSLSLLVPQLNLASIAPLVDQCWQQLRNVDQGGSPEAALSKFESQLFNE